MRSKITIASLVLGVVCLKVAIAVWLILAFGVAGLIIVLATAIVGLVFYVPLVRPWMGRWGATELEARRAMPGDDIIPDANAATRAITIDASCADVWPWLVQIGYGRAGWYSYDWIDNDGRPSAERIVPEFQNLAVGDQITMIPGMGPRVREIAPERYILSGDEMLGTWCLMLEPVAEGRTRLISRWRAKWKVTPASLFWIAITEPGSFIMEQKMLRGIKRRAEHASLHQEVSARS